MLPPYLKCAKSGEELLPCLYFTCLQDISTADFHETLGAFFGEKHMVFLEYHHQIEIAMA
ncbi:MAG: hypothetical protein ACTS73_03460 [Arsenophonus sp. NEOnobi-MAG3]